MNVLAIYSVNQHLADLHLEAEHERLLRSVPRKPSALRRAAASIKAAFTSRSSAPRSATAPAAS